MYRLILSAIIVLCLAACAEGPTGPSAGGPSELAPGAGTDTAFDARDFMWSTARGTATIEGAANVRRGAIRYSCQGSDVLLTPETAWSRRRMLILYGAAGSAAVPVSIVRARTPTAGAGDYARFVRRTVCDVGDHFSFRDLPDGSWFVITITKPVDGAGEPMAVTRRVQTRGGVTTTMLF